MTDQASVPHLFSSDYGNDNRNLGAVLANLVDFMDISVWELDCSYRIVAANHKGLAVYGADIIGKRCHEVTQQSDAICVNCPVKHVYKHGKPWRAEQDHVDIHGRPVFVEHFATPITDEKSNVSGVLVLLVDISAHKAVEKELKAHKVLLEKKAGETRAKLAQSEGRFAVAFDASPDAITINRLEDGLYVEVNKGFTDLTGYTAEEVVGRISADIRIWHDPADRQLLVERLWEEGFCENLEAVFRRKDGSLTEALMSARLIGLNREPHIISITRDISNLKKLEKTNAAQRKLFETMFNAIEDGIVVTNTRREIELANDGMLKTFGYSKEELLGQSTRMLYADEQEYQDAGKKVFNDQTQPASRTYSGNYRHKAGRIFPGATFAARLYDQENQWIGNLGIMRDVTREKKSEAERDKLIAAVQQAGEAIIITDPQGVIEFVNPAFEEITGYTRDEILGENPRILQSGKHTKAFYDELWHTILNGRTFKGRMVNKRKDGSLYTEEATISPVIAADGTIVNYVGVKRDISSQLKIEQQLQQAQKMEAIGRLTGGVAHDFNNILAVILGHAEMGLSSVSPEDAVYDDLQVILDAAERSAAIVRQLLAFSRRQTIAPQKLDLNDTVAGMLKMLRRLIGENISLHWHPLAESLPVKMDPSQMDQILANLCVNAKDAITDHGNITIETVKTVFDENYCTAHAGFKVGVYAMLAVTDDGLGIAAKDLESVFEPFFTTKKLGRGTGLGLSTVYGIVKQNEGFVNIYSEPGQGTVVKLYLPIYYDEGILQKEVSKRQKTVGGSETVLLVEDDGAIRTMVQSMLTSLGYMVLSAANPMEAIALALSANVAVDLLLTDVVMPKMNGKELARRLRADLPQLKCLYMSGYTTNVIAHKGVLSADVHFIQKPFAKALLARKIREVLEE